MSDATNPFKCDGPDYYIWEMLTLRTRSLWRCIATMDKNMGVVWPSNEPIRLGDLAILFGDDEENTNCGILEMYGAIAIENEDELTGVRGIPQ